MAHVKYYCTSMDIFNVCWIPRCLISGTQVWKHSLTVCPLATTQVQVCCFLILKSHYILHTEPSYLSTLSWLLCFSWNNNSFTPWQMKQPCLQTLQIALCNVLQSRSTNSVYMQAGFCGNLYISCTVYGIVVV